MDPWGHWEGKQGEEWVMLERFVFRRDGVAKPLPENETTASSSTCIRVRFRVSLGLVSPPSPSRFYLEWPGGPDPDATIPCHLVAAHRDCVLFRLTSFVRTKTHPRGLMYGDDYYIYRPSAGNLKRLPTCFKKAKPVAAERVQEQPELSESESSESASEEESVVTKEVMWAREVERMELERTLALGVEVDEDVAVVRSPLVMESLGLLCGCSGDEFVVAELLLDKGNRKVSADISFLHSGTCEWVHIPQLPIQCNNRHDFADLRCFGPRAVVPFGDSLCWVDSNIGIILAQNVLEQAPKLSYIPLPLRSPRWCEDSHRSVCATDGGNLLKFIAVVVDDNEHHSSTGFTIQSYKLITAEEGHMKWEEENRMTSEELWGLQAPERIPREVPMFPLVSLDKPQIIHFQLTECTDYIDTVTVVTIDMSVRSILSVLTHIKGEQELRGEDADVAEARTNLPKPFLPATLFKSRPVNLTRKRKGSSALLPDTAPNKVKLMCSYCKRHSESEVPDPYYGGSQGFEKVLDLLEDACESLLDSIVADNANISA